MTYVLENSEPTKRKGLGDARYVSYAYGRNDVPGYMNFTDNVRKAKKWKTERGAERYLSGDNIEVVTREIVAVFQARKEADRG